MKSCIKISLLFLWPLAGFATGASIVTDGAELGIHVMGMIVGRLREDNVALLKTAGGAVKAVKSGFLLEGGIQILAITSDYVEVKHGSDKVYRLQQDKFASMSSRKALVHATSPNQNLQIPEDMFREEGFERHKGRIKMTGMYRDRLVKEDLARVLMQATVEPSLENGQIGGFKITQIDAGSIYDKSGFVNGDIITHINEQELSSVATSIKLLQSLKGANHMDVDIRRGDQKLRLTVDVH